MYDVRTSHCLSSCENESSMNDNQHNMKTYIFSYGSLLDPQSRHKTVPESQLIDKRAVLNGYERIMNISAEGHPYVYMNIQKAPNKDVAGVIFAVTDNELESLDSREHAYIRTEISSFLEKSYGQNVFAYIAEGQDVADKQVLQSYVDTCLRGVPALQHEQWIKETIILSEILDDSQDIQYEFHGSK